MKPFDTTFTFSVLSKYRTELLGLSAILIMLFHFHLWQLFPEFTKYVLRFAFGAVDIFLFLSGVGLCYSMNKNESILSFYSRRFSKIYPSFAMVTVITLLIGHKTVLSMIFLFTGITYWLAPFFNVDAGFWYISLIIPLYVVFPYLYRFSKSASGFQSLCMLTICFALPYIVHFMWDNCYDYALTRITPFLLGVILYSNRNKITNMGVPLITVSIIFFVILNAYSALSGGANIHKTLIQLSMLGLIAPGFSLIFCISISKCPQFIRKILNWFGLMSLELYMVHLTLYHWIKTPLLLFFLSIVVSYLIWIVSRKIQKAIEKL